jgi:hypothetical protein
MKKYALHLSAPIKKCFIIGKGASLRGFDFNLLDGEYKMCLNHAVFKVPDPSALVFCDKGFYTEYKEFIDTFEGDVYSSVKGTQRGFITPLHGVGSLSGLFALYVALQRSERVYLLGYDMNTTTEYPYWADDFPGKTREDFEKMDGSMRLFYDQGTFNSDRIARFDEIFSDYTDRVFNCNPNSAIKTFDFVDIKEII